MDWGRARGRTAGDIFIVRYLAIAVGLEFRVVLLPDERWRQRDSKGRVHCHSINNVIREIVLDVEDLGGYPLCWLNWSTINTLENKAELSSAQSDELIIIQSALSDQLMVCPLLREQWCSKTIDKTNFQYSWVLFAFY